MGISSQLINKELALRKPTACSCNDCIDMCKTCPCLGTPADIKKIIEAGHRNKLIETYWAAGMEVGLPLIKMITPRQLPDNSCAFLTSDNLCSLHNSNLKPTEGKLTQAHTMEGIDTIRVIPTVYLVAATWLTEETLKDRQFCAFYVHG